MMEKCEICEEDGTPWRYINGHICIDCSDRKSSVNNKNPHAVKIWILFLLLSFSGISIAAGIQYHPFMCFGILLLVLTVVMFFSTFFFSMSKGNFSSDR